MNVSSPSLLSPRDPGTEVSVNLVGIGGQGIIQLGKKLFGDLEGLYGSAMSTEMRGFSKKRGTVLTYLRAGSNILSARHPSGRADIVVALEQQELLRHREFIGEGTLCLVSDIIVASSLARANPNEVKEAIRQLLRARGARGLWVPLAGEVIASGVDERASGLIMQEVVRAVLGLHTGSVGVTLTSIT
jgi:Pyruvate/2-oxoacid:ferredoxin oxidoreductase gamma subunit